MGKRSALKERITRRIRERLERTCPPYIYRGTDPGVRRQWWGMFVIINPVAATTNGIRRGAERDGGMKDSARKTAGDRRKSVVEARAHTADEM